MGTPAVPVDEAVPALADRVRRGSLGASDAARALGGIGPDAADAVPVLRAALAGKDALLAQSAAEALGKIGAKDRETVTALAERVKDKSAPLPTRALSAWALGDCGAAARPAVPGLLDLLAEAEAEGAPGANRFGRHRLNMYLEDPESIRPAPHEFSGDPRGCALIALAKIGPEAKAAAPALLKLLQDRKADAFERWRAGEALAAIGASDRDTVKGLIDVLKDDDAPVAAQVGAVHALAAAGRAARDAVPLLTEAKTERPTFVRRAATEALGKIGK
jgi:HEAT repeat protein